MRRFVSSLYGVGMFMFFPQSVYAQTDCPPELKTDFGCLPPDPVGFVEKFYGIGIWLITSVAFLFLVVGGYYLLTSQGNPSRIQKGKSFIFYAIAGLLLAIFGFILIEFIVGDIIRLPGFE